jgi:hypothetical protein
MRMTIWRTFAERVAALFPDDPHLPALVAACERDDLALAVYLGTDLFRHLWTHERRHQKDLRAFLNNGAWPAMAADACLERGLPLPAWCADWLRKVVSGESAPPDSRDRQRAAHALRLWNEVTAPEQSPDDDNDDGVRPRPPRFPWKAHARFNRAGELILAEPVGAASPQGTAAAAIGMNEKAARALIAVFREYWKNRA